MINTHLPNADEKFEKFKSELTEKGYFPKDEKSDLYKKLMEIAKKTFVEETTVLTFLFKLSRKHYPLNIKIWQTKNSKLETLKLQLNFMKNLFDYFQLDQQLR
jgi:hypothetical protein